MTSRATLLALALALSACSPRGPAASAASPAASSASTSTPTIPADAPPLVIEYVVLRRAWVERVVPVPDEPTSEEAEQAYRRAQAPALATKLADELASRLRKDATAREAIADAVNAVLGERALNDAARPAAHAVLRAKLEQVRLPAAAKAALVAFARGARPGDAMPSPAVDGDTIVVARARAPGAE